MRIAVIKKINEKLPYWMKRPFSQIIRNQLINNKIFLRQYELLTESDVMTESEIDKLQLEKLRRILDHAYQHTVYYRELMDRIGFKPDSVLALSDLKRLPVLSKKIIRENYEKLKADNIDDFYEVRTGGTTGAPTRVLMERDAIYREWAFIYHYWSKYGYNFKTSKLATLRGVDLGSKLYEINPLYQEIRLNVFRLNRDHIKTYIQQIGRYGADFIYGYPSAIYNFCRLAKEVGIGLKKKFKAVFLISENLYDFQEKEIIKVLGCPMAMFYGHTERAVYAEKYDAGYIFQPLYGVTEIGENGFPVVTGFINGKMPLIRYEMDDSVERLGKRTQAGDNCSAGKDPYRIIGHRNDDILYGKNGEQISAAAINFHDNTFANVKSYQFVQDIPGKCYLNVIPIKGELSETDCRRIAQNVSKKLYPALICEVKSCFETILTERGKYRMVIQNWKEDEESDGL